MPRVATTRIRTRSRLGDTSGPADRKKKAGRAGSDTYAAKTKSPADTTRASKEVELQGKLAVLGYPKNVAHRIARLAPEVAREICRRKSRPVTVRRGIFVDPSQYESHFGQRGTLAGYQPRPGESRCISKGQRWVSYGTLNDHSADYAFAPSNRPAEALAAYQKLMRRGVRFYGVQVEMVVPRFLMPRSLRDGSHAIATKKMPDERPFIHRARTIRIQRKGHPEDRTETGIRERLIWKYEGTEKAMTPWLRWETFEARYIP